MLLLSLMLNPMHVPAFNHFETSTTPPMCEYEQCSFDSKLLFQAILLRYLEKKSFFIQPVHVLDSTWLYEGSRKKIN